VVRTARHVPTANPGSNRRGGTDCSVVIASSTVLSSCRMAGCGRRSPRRLNCLLNWSVHGQCPPRPTVSEFACPRSPRMMRDFACPRGSSCDADPPRPVITPPANSERIRLSPQSTYDEGFRLSPWQNTGARRVLNGVRSRRRKRPARRCAACLTPRRAGMKSEQRAHRATDASVVGDWRLPPVRPFC
jgi:hypothetical protein